MQPRQNPERARVPKRHAQESQNPQYFTRAAAFFSDKEKFSQELSRKLYAQGIITAPGAPFEASRKQEIDGHLGKGVFEFIPWDPQTMTEIRLFGSRMVDEVKE